MNKEQTLIEGWIEKYNVGVNLETDFNCIKRGFGLALLSSAECSEPINVLEPV